MLLPMRGSGAYLSPSDCPFTNSSYVQCVNGTFWLSDMQLSCHCFALYVGQVKSNYKTLVVSPGHTSGRMQSQTVNRCDQQKL